jgi:hypothetical protein
VVRTRRRATWLCVIAAATITAPLLGSTVSSADGAPPIGPGMSHIAAAPVAQPPGALEVDVMNEAVRGGEPELAINPTDPQNLLLGHTVVANNYANDSFQAGFSTNVHGGLQSSSDGGQTWTPDQAPPFTVTEGPDPFLEFIGHPGATGFTSKNMGGDPVEASGPDGSLYAGGVVVGPVITSGPIAYDDEDQGGNTLGFEVDQGAIAVARSTDGGKTFGPTSTVLSDQELLGMVQRGMHPSLGGFGVNPFDRPWISVDQSNGDVYISTTAHPERYVAVSHDHASTWGPVEALDCDPAPTATTTDAVTCGAYPESGGGSIAAALGVLGAGYIAGAAPGHSCPCAVFETSTDAGAHWSRHVVADNLPDGSDIFIAADSFNQGHFAVLVLPGHSVPAGLAGLSAGRNVPQGVAVVTTADSGNTWSFPWLLGDEAAAHITNRPWISYTSVKDGSGPTGVLAVLWRNAYPPYNPGSVLVPGTQNVFVAVSADNGATFGAPVQLNSAASPPPDPKQFAEDDVSWVVVTTQYVYGAWGDWRPTPGNPVAPQASPPSGELNSWITRVPVSSFG